MTTVDATFDELESMLFQVTVNAFSRFTADFVQEAKETAKSLDDNFFTLLATRGKYMDVDDGYFAGYQKLSDDYIDKKARAGIIGGGDGDSRFYFGLGKGGHLINTLKRKTGSMFFGNPNVTVQEAKAADGIDVSSGRVRIAKGLPKAGTFAKLSNVQTQILIEMFPKVRRNARGKELTDFLGDSKWAKKLAMNDQGGGKLPARPLFTPFFNWYVESHMPEEIKRRLQL